MHRFDSFMVIVIPLVIAAIAFRGAWNVYAMSEAARGWPRVDGTITWSELEEGKDEDDGSPVYRANVQYTYTFGEAEHIGYRSAMGADEWGQLRSSRSRIVDKYPVGKGVRVYVNPSRPSESLLDPQNIGQIRWYAFIAVVAIGISIVAAFTD